MSIKVVDSIMGSGKSTWAINHMNANPDKRYIYIAQFLDEVQRIKDSCPGCYFCEPFDTPSKQYNFKKLLQDNRNIVTTHALFSQLCLSNKEIEDIRSRQYTIFIDETVETVDVFKVSKGDLKILFDADLIKKEADGRIAITDEGRTREENRYKEVLSYVKAGSVFMHKNTCLMWIFPPELFSLSDSIFILTYLFDASHMKHTLQMYGYAYDIYHIEGEGMNLTLVEGCQQFTAQRNHISQLINLYNGEYNRLGERKFDLAAGSWGRKTKTERDAVANAARNYFRRWATGTALHVNDCMWTVYKGIKDKISVKDYDNAWCAFNLRATNQYRHCTALAYLVNVFEDPTIIDWFKSKGETLDNDAYALSIMIQWIWRSAIRTDQQINLFLPSKRMRNLLNTWLEG